MMKYIVGVCSDIFEDNGDGGANEYVELCEFGTEDQAYKYIYQCIGILKLMAQNPSLVKVDDMDSLGNIRVWNPKGIDDPKNCRASTDFDVCHSGDLEW